MEERGMKNEELRNTRNTRKDVLFAEESYEIMGACFEVYREKGCGFLEAVYQECLALELSDRGIPFMEKPTLGLSYKGKLLVQTYQPDFVCYEKIIVELKAVNTLLDEHRAQVVNYLKASQIELGLLINFGHYPMIEHERFVNQRGYERGR
jgi:GxxExxY protein